VTFYVSWWIYHFCCSFLYVAAVLGLVVQYQRRDSIVRFIVGLFSDDPTERLAAGISPSVRKLIMQTEALHPWHLQVTCIAWPKVRLTWAVFEAATGRSACWLRAGLSHDVGKMQSAG
jgi:hypothetical protein